MSDNKQPTFLQAFGGRVRNHRKWMRWTQRELCERAGLSVGFLSDVENGKRSVSLINAVNLAHALGVDLSKLIRD
jgi:transcriptional regulator with XRE-family HTH domain